MRFEKWQALGNDYIIVERDELPFELTPERVRRICAAHFGCALRRRAAALAAQRPALRGLAADLQPGRLGGGAVAATARARRSSTCAATAGPTRTSSRSRPPRARSGRRSPPTAPAASRWAARGCSSPDFPSGGDDGRGTRDRRRPRVRVPAREHRQPAVRDRGRGRARGARPRRASARRSSAASCSRTARTCRSSDVESERPRARADLRARGGGDAVVRHRRLRRRRGGGAARRARAR